MAGNKLDPNIERKRHYRAFEIYRDLGYGRTLREVARQVGASPTSVSRWARMYEWNERLVKHAEVVEKKKKDGALVKVDDPVSQKMFKLLEQAEAVIDSVFLLDDSGEIAPRITVKNADELVKLITEYRRLLESYYKFVAAYKPDAGDRDKVTRIKEFNVIMGNMSQEERIAMMERLRDGHEQGGNKRASGNISDADFTKVSERGTED